MKPTTTDMLVPDRPILEQRLAELIDAGLIEWSGQRLEPLTPLSIAKDNRAVADLLLEDRE